MLACYLSINVWIQIHTYWLLTWQSTVFLWRPVNIWDTSQWNSIFSSWLKTGLIYVAFSFSLFLSGESTEEGKRCFPVRLTQAGVQGGGTVSQHVAKQTHMSPGWGQPIRLCRLDMSPRSLVDRFHHEGDGGAPKRCWNLTGRVHWFFYTSAEPTENPAQRPINMKLGSNSLYNTINMFYICQQEPP